MTQNGVAVIWGCWIRVLRGQPVVDRDNNCPGPVGQTPTLGVVGLHASDHPATTVVVDGDGCRVVCSIGCENPYRETDPARTGEGQILDRGHLLALYGSCLLVVHRPELFRGQTLSRVKTVWKGSQDFLD